jgi:hypothetical protein
VYCKARIRITLMTSTGWWSLSATHVALLGKTIEQSTWVADGITVN